MSRSTYAERNLSVFDTESPVAFITGSASDRVGRKIAELLLERDFRVAFHGRIADSKHDEYIGSLIETGRQVMLVTGEIQDDQNTQAWLRQILDRWARVDLVVNSAAIWEPITLEQTTIEHLRQHWEVNSLGSFLNCQYFGLHMAKQSSGGAIVNIGDWATTRPYLDFSAYFLSKGCVEVMTKSLAVELANRNPRVRVNAVLPGPVMLADGISQPQHQRIVEDCLLKRAGTAGDLAEAVHFLATNPFVTGVCMPVDGGRTVYSGGGSDSIAHPKVNSRPPPVV